MGRAPCCDKANVKKGPWSPEEDAKLKSYIEQNGTGGNWIALPQKIGLKRCGKSCRLRWLNYLRPNIKHGGFSEEEDRIICSLYSSIGSRWSIIAGQLPGRTDNDIKNYWNTRLKKKLLGKQRKEQSGRRSKRLALSDHHNQMNNYDIITAPPLPNLPSNFNTQPMFPYSYWPPPPPPPIDPAAGQLFSEDDSIRSLLLKLDHHPHPVYYDEQQQDGLVNLHPPIISTNGHDDHHHLISSMLNLDGQTQMIAPHLEDDNPTSFPQELEELMSSSVVNQRMDGRDLFQGETSCGETTTTTTSWFEMSSLISLPMLNNVSSHQLRYPGN